MQNLLIDMSTCAICFVVTGVSEDEDSDIDQLHNGPTPFFSGEFMCR